MNVGEVGWSGIDWSGLGKGQVVGPFECSNEPLGLIKCWEILE
jgi:hypothetical protein